MDRTLQHFRRGGGRLRDAQFLLAGEKMVRMQPVQRQTVKHQDQIQDLGFAARHLVLNRVDPLVEVLDVDVKIVPSSGGDVQWVGVESPLVADVAADTQHYRIIRYVAVSGARQRRCHRRISAEHVGAEQPDREREQTPAAPAGKDQPREGRGWSRREAIRPRRRCRVEAWCWAAGYLHCWSLRFA